ncbi:GNAT family N-acetyltransferase [Kocuria tytonicola]|uniref:GNAT family N-acetyltransferase n=1 Tax=Kocuria tytonicola TaxID=2055946 RepID=UPI000EF8F755|nr:GNAT family protein [Kocuria tytonicola]RLZ02380.1 GNAT family N-acetyltransferase [Kocuria tytonicola]
MPRTLDDLTWPRRTERLTVARLSPEDADVVWELKSDPALNRWTTRVYATREEFRADWDALVTTHLMARWDGRLAGYLMVKQQDAWSQADVAERARGQQVELGWVVAPWAQGQGIATELVREGLSIAFDMGVHRVEASCFAENTGSWKVMEKVGMRREIHTVKESLHRDGQWHDGLGYAMLAEEHRER